MEDCFSRIDYKLHEKLSYDKDDDIMKQKTNLSCDDKIVLFHDRYDGDPLICVDIPHDSPTVYTVMKLIETGMHTKLISGNRGRHDDHVANYYFTSSGHKRYKNTVVYRKIAEHFDKEARLHYVNQFENGELPLCSLFCDEIYFEGLYRQGNYLFMSLGS